MISSPNLRKHVQYIIQTAYFLDVYPPSQRLLLYPTIQHFEKSIQSSFHNNRSIEEIIQDIYTFRDKLCLLLLKQSHLSLPDIVKFFYKFTVPNDSVNFIQFLMDNMTDIPPTRTQQQIQHVRNTIHRRQMLYSILRRKGTVKGDGETRHSRHEGGGDGVEGGGDGGNGGGDGGGLVFKTRRSRHNLHQGGGTVQGGTVQGGAPSVRRSRHNLYQGGRGAPSGGGGGGKIRKQVMSSISKIKERFNRIQLMEMLGLSLEQATVLVNLAEIHNRLEQIQIDDKKMEQEKRKLQQQKRKYVLPSLTTSSSLSTLFPPPPPPPPPPRPSSSR